MGIGSAGAPICRYREKVFPFVSVVFNQFGHEDNYVSIGVVKPEKISMLAPL